MEILAVKRSASFATLTISNTDNHLQHWPYVALTMYFIPPRQVHPTEGVIPLDHGGWWPSGLSVKPSKDTLPMMDDPEVGIKTSSLLSSFLPKKQAVGSERLLLLGPAFLELHCMVKCSMLV